MIKTWVKTEVISVTRKTNHQCPHWRWRCVILCLILHIWSQRVKRQALKLPTGHWEIHICLHPGSRIGDHEALHASSVASRHTLLKWSTELQCHSRWATWRDWVKGKEEHHLQDRRGHIISIKYHIMIFYVQRERTRILYCLLHRFRCVSILCQSAQNSIHLWPKKISRLSPLQFASLYSSCAGWAANLHPIRMQTSIFNSMLSKSLEA